MEEAEHLRHSYDIKQIYAKRKETIERVFADAKEKHGMRWTTLRGIKLSMQAMLTFCHEFKETGYLDVASSLREQLCSKSMLDLVIYYQISGRHRKKMIKALESELLEGFCLSGRNSYHYSSFFYIFFYTIIYLVGHHMWEELLKCLGKIIK